jgi:hypothetical protein
MSGTTTCDVLQVTAVCTMFTSVVAELCSPALSRGCCVDRERARPQPPPTGLVSCAVEWECTVDNDAVRASHVDKLQTCCSLSLLGSTWPVSAGVGVYVVYYFIMSTPADIGRMQLGFDQGCQQDD